LAEKLLRFGRLVATEKKVLTTCSDMEHLMMRRVPTRALITDFVVNRSIAFYQYEIATALKYVEDFRSVRV